MPTGGSEQTWEFLERLSTGQLIDLMRADTGFPEDGDDALMLRILEVMERREKEHPTGRLTGAGEAWEDFQRYFNTPDGTDRPLYPMRDSGPTAPGETARNRRGQKRLKRRLTAVAVAVTISCMITVQALGFDVFGSLARWTEETFHFAAGPDSVRPEAEALRQAIQGAFDRCGIEVPAPAWYPEGTVLEGDIQVTEGPENTGVACGFTYEEKSFSIVAQRYCSKECVSEYVFEKDATEAEEYASNGRLFYIMSNFSKSRAVYSDRQTVITINGELSLGNLKQMIDSIGE